MDHNLKNQVKTYYGGIAKKVNGSTKASCGCGSGCCGDNKHNAELYTKEYLDHLPEEAVNASLGCANPIFLANLQKGETVLDLGSGGGIDALISSKYVGSEGMVYGLDMTDEMLKLANKNKAEMGVQNVNILKGYLEDIPLKEEMVDVITSNCVINLCEDKLIALKEAYRVLKKGGRLAIADIVQLREVPEDVKTNIEMWLGCMAGALDMETYRAILQEAGFHNIEIEPVNLYTKEILEEIIGRKELGDLFAHVDVDQMDGAFAGAHVKAIK